MNTVLIFGASGLIGGACARQIRSESPNSTLRLATSNPAKVADLAERFPAAEVVVVDYLNLSTLIPAFEGVVSALVVTPDFLDEKRAMVNVTAAAQHAGTVRHIVRIMGEAPYVRDELDLPEIVRNFQGTALQHLHARQVLELVDLPVTFLNSVAYFFEDFATMFAGPLSSSRTLVVPFDRLMGFIDSSDIGEAAAKLLLADDPTPHVGMTYNVDNGHDLMRFRDVAALMTDTWGEQIAFDDTEDTFRRECGDLITATFGTELAVDYFLRFFEFEQGHEGIWARSDLLERLLGRTPNTLRQWLSERRDVLLGTATSDRQQDTGALAVASALAGE